MNARTELAVYETFEDVFGNRSTLDELVEDIRCFSRESVLWTCAFIVTGMQLWNQPQSNPGDVFDQLLLRFFGTALRLRLTVGYWSSSPRRFLFHRRQLLLISKLAILHCSGRGVNAWTGAERFGLVLLKANDQFHYDLLPHHPTPRGPEREDYARIITEMVAVGEHASPHIAHMITRSHLMLTRFLQELRDDPDFVDVAAEHEKVTGLTIDEFEAMIFGAHARFGGDLGRKIFAEPRLLPLKDRDFESTAITARQARAFLESLAADLGKMWRELSSKDNGPNDFTIFRKYPLLQMYFNMHLTTAWCGFLMMDNLFFLEKIRTNPYWVASATHGLKLHKFWGTVFERYVNELMRRSCAGTAAMFIPNPMPVGNPNIQICDGIVISGNSMVLMEYKSSMFRADNKYSGDYLSLAGEIERKLVNDVEAGQKRGVWQLAEAVRKLFEQGSSITLSEIDLNTIKRVYPYIVTLDSIGSTIGMSPFLNTFLEERLEKTAFPSIEIRPLFCSDVEALEVATGLFSVRSLPELLEQWFQTNPSLTTPFSAIEFDGIPWRENDWLRNEWNVIYKNMIRILFPDKNPEVALEEAMKTLLRQRGSA